MKFYHGSTTTLEVDTVLTGRGLAYENSWGDTDFYKILEKYRPEESIPHKEAVFMVGHPDDIDLAGGATDWCFEVVPNGKVTRHDLNWSTEISILISEGKKPDSKDVIKAAKNYWEGIPHQNEPVWEYLCYSANIVAVDEYENFVVSHDLPSVEEWDSFSRCQAKMPSRHRP